MTRRSVLHLVTWPSTARPCGGEGTDKSPVDWGQLGWKWSIAIDEVGIPIGWIVYRAKHNDHVRSTLQLRPVFD